MSKKQCYHKETLEHKRRWPTFSVPPSPLPSLWVQVGVCYCCVYSTLDLSSTGCTAGGRHHARIATAVSGRPQFSSSETFIAPTSILVYHLLNNMSPAPTQKDKTIDLCYGNIPGAFRSFTLPPTGNSDHNTVHLVPACRSRVQTEKVEKKPMRVWSPECVSELQGCFDCTEWNVLIGSSESVNEAIDVVSSYIEVEGQQMGFSWGQLHMLSMTDRYWGSGFGDICTSRSERNKLINLERPTEKRRQEDSLSSLLVFLCLHFVCLFFTVIPFIFFSLNSCGYFGKFWLLSCIKRTRAQQTWHGTDNMYQTEHELNRRGLTRTITLQF